MSDVSNSIVVGVVSGVITSVVVWLFILLAKHVILPWYQSITYRGGKIHGEWIGFYQHVAEGVSTSDNDPNYSISIDQKGHHIRGTLIRHVAQNGERDLKVFLFQGLFKDGNLVIWYKPQDETRMGMGSYVMKLINDGRKMEGESLYITSNNGDVANFATTWKRKAK
jgi:hypothetical protein